MEIILIVLTSAIISAVLFAAYRIGFAEGKKAKEDETDKIEVNDRNMKMLQDYLDFASYTGDTRKDSYGN